MLLWAWRRTRLCIIFLTTDAQIIPSSGCGIAQIHGGGNAYFTSHTGITCVMIHFSLCEIQHSPWKAFCSDVSPKALCWRLLSFSQAGHLSLHYYSEAHFILFSSPFPLCWHALIWIFFKLLLITDDVSSSHLTAKTDWNGHLLNKDAMHCTPSSCAAQANSVAFLPLLLCPFPHVHNLLSSAALSKTWNYSSAALIATSIIKADPHSLDAM